MIIALTGTPGTGKSTLATYIKDQFSNAKRRIHILRQHYLVKKYTLDTEYDTERDCYVIDKKLFENALKAEVKERKEDILLVDSHLSHFLSPKLIDLCIVCTCPISLLEKRLIKRRYSQQKRQENREAEIFEVCLSEAQEKGHTILVYHQKKGLFKKEFTPFLKQ